MLDDNDFKIGLPTIWAIGVGSAVGGDFFGEIIIRTSIYTLLVIIFIC